MNVLSSHNENERIISSHYTQSTGIPQGYVLGPLTFYHCNYSLGYFCSLPVLFLNIIHTKGTDLLFFPIPWLFYNNIWGQSTFSILQKHPCSVPCSFHLQDYISHRHVQIWIHHCVRKRLITSACFKDAISPVKSQCNLNRRNAANNPL